MAVAVFVRRSVQDGCGNSAKELKRERMPLPGFRLYACANWELFAVCQASCQQIVTLVKKVIYGFARRSDFFRSLFKPMKQGRDSDGITACWKPHSHCAFCNRARLHSLLKKVPSIPLC